MKSISRTKLLNFKRNFSFERMSSKNILRSKCFSCIFNIVCGLQLSKTTLEKILNQLLKAPSFAERGLRDPDYCALIQADWMVMEQIGQICNCKLQVTSFTRRQFLQIKNPLVATFKLASFKEEQRPDRFNAASHVGWALLFWPTCVARSGRSDTTLRWKELYSSFSLRLFEENSKLWPQCITFKRGHFLNPNGSLGQFFEWMSQVFGSKAIIIQKRFLVLIKRCYFSLVFSLWSFFDWPE